jgi:hypothetical protein
VGFPDASREAAIEFYETVFASGNHGEFRYTMASKLGTSKQLDHTRMAATMAEFNVDWLLVESGYDTTPEIDVTTGHAMACRAEKEGHWHASRSNPSAPADRASREFWGGCGTRDGRHDDRRPLVRPRVRGYTIGRLLLVPG